jgi:uncharacterized protein (TIGR02145 family)
MKTHFKNPATHFAMLLMILAMSFTFFACNSSEKCNGKEYDSKTHFCYNDSEIKEKCGGKEYSVRHFCSGNEVFDKCGGTTFFNGNEYNPETHFCDRDKFFEKCNGKEYNTETNICSDDGILEEKCGNKGYNPETQFCDSRNNKIYRHITIGTLTWMAEDLDYDVKGSEYYTYSKNCDTDPDNCELLRFYDWVTAMALPAKCNNPCPNLIEKAHTGVCPSGWHIPSRDEWEYLAMAAEGSNGAVLGRIGYWWSATEYGNYSAYYWRNGLDSREDYRVNSLRESQDNKKQLSTTLRCVRGDIPNADSINANNSKGERFTDSRDKQEYRMVKIGIQTWMAENLNYKADNSKCYGEDESNCKKYGRLYDWETAKTVCPSGWHLPSREEWKELTEMVGGTKVASKKLRSKTGWHFVHNYGTDEFGFSALSFGNNGYWSTTESTERSKYDIAEGKTRVYILSITEADKTEELGRRPESDFSVRCVLSKGKEEASDTSEGNTFTDARDGKTYKTVKISERVWMAENLNVETKDSKCYDNKPANCDKYGRLYRWSTAMKVCPSGWHLPNEYEWKSLDLGNSQTVGKKLKSASGWNKNGNGLDVFGFTALPGGLGYSDGGFGNVGNDGFWWSSSEYNSGHAYIWNMGENIEHALWSTTDKNKLFSVRCVMD